MKTTMEIDKLETISGGYSLEIFDKDTIIQRYLCAICGKVLKDAIQMPLLNVPTRACLECYTATVR